MKNTINLKELLSGKMDEIKPVGGANLAIEDIERTVPKNLLFDAEATVFRPETRPMGVEMAKGLTVEEAQQLEDKMNRFIDAVLVSGVDYGIIPHCSKPSLLKPGAEKIITFLGLIARTEITNRSENYDKGFFSYEAKVFLIDYNGVIRGEGVGACNSQESKYQKQSGFSLQNVILKMTKKRALVDAVLNVGNLSARFTQDVEDMNLSDGSDEQQSYQHSHSTEKPASQKQLSYLKTLMDNNNISADVMNRYVKETYGITDYQLVPSRIASELIERLRTAK